ncbi:MAG: cytochrome c [Bryobacteraceae bacterium]|jgi:mono/diheme cytochrome c family protein
MRIVCLVAFLLSSVLLPAQETATKIKKVPASPTSAASGKEMFDAYCASCHGVDGKGNGPAAPALKKQPTDLTLLAQKNGGEFPTMHVMSSIRDVTQNVHGSKDMPVWGPILSSVSSNSPAIVTQRISNLTKYIESLQMK